MRGRRSLLVAAVAVTVAAAELTSSDLSVVCGKEWDADLVAALWALRTRQATERLAAGAVYEASGYVAVDELGAPVHPEWLTDEFGRLAAAAGLPRIRLHDCRHTMNSLLAAAGVPDHIRAAWCGHTVAVNVSTYLHARPEDMAVAARALSGILRAAL